MAKGKNQYVVPTKDDCGVKYQINSKLTTKTDTKADAIGEKLGIYRDYPTSKGCTSPFAPIWINEMVKRQQA